MRKFRQTGLLRLVATFALAAGALASVPTYAADAYPSHPITMIVPWNAGGAIDLTGRKIAELLGQKGVKVIVENMAGASSLIGLGRVARAAPDGYTIGLATPSLMGAIAQHTTQLTQRDFTVLNEAGVDPLVLVVPKNSPANDIAGFIKLMKDKPKGASIGIPGSNNVNQIFAASLAQAAKVQYTDVPYTGGAKVLVDVAGGQLDGGVVKPSESAGQIKGGLVKAIGVFANSRVPALPDVPTFAEKGVNVFPYGAMESVTYIVAPKGISKDVQARAEKMFAEVIGSADYQKFTQDYGMTIADKRSAEMSKEVLGIQNTFNVVAPKIFTPE